MPQIKFADKFYDSDTTLSELVEQLEVENGFVVKYKNQKEPTAQELIDEC